MSCKLHSAQERRRSSEALSVPKCLAESLGHCSKGLESPTQKCKAMSPLVQKIYPFFKSECWLVLPEKFNLLETGENTWLTQEAVEVSQKGLVGEQKNSLLYYFAVPYLAIASMQWCTRFASVCLISNSLKNGQAIREV